MIADLLQVAAERAPDAEFLIDARNSISFASARDAMEARKRAWTALTGQRIGLRMDADASALLDLLALDAVGARPYLYPADLGDDVTQALEERLFLDGMLPELKPRGGRHRETPGEVALLTSGTTGTPKATLHEWRTLLQRVRPAQPGRWLLTYGAATFAGIQVFMHALASCSALVVGRGSPADLASLGADAGADHVSGTPTFYRLMLATSRREALTRWRPTQLTLGGEAVDQTILDALRRSFPDARVTHLYASTEMGVCFSVHDGQAGFPAAYLGCAELPAELAVEDGMLLIRPRHGMRCYLDDDLALRSDGFHVTGDRVRVVGDRVHFLGRNEERINVGGRKVYAREVEQVLLEVDGVCAVRVTGAPSSVVGQIVKAEVLPSDGEDPAALKQRLTAHARSRLARHQVPRLVTFVNELPLTSSGKVVRR